MGFWDSVGGAVLGGFTGGITNSIMGAIDRPPTTKRMSQYGVRLGHSEDTRSYKERDQYDWQQAKNRGLTPQEFYGSSAAGGSSSSGGANVLGNSLDKQNIQKQSMHQESQQRNLDRATQLQQTKMQTDSQQTVAQIQAGVQTAGQKITETLGQGNLKVMQAKLANDTRKLKADLRISDQQFKLLSNQIAISTKKFTLYMKKLSMGVDNMMVEFLQHSYGVDITDPKSVQAMSPAQKAAFINHTAAINSHAFREAAGITLGVSDRAGTIGSSTPNILGNSMPQSKSSDYVHGSIHNKQNRFKTLKKSKMRSQRY